MMPLMAENKSISRLTESLPGKLAGWLLAALWIFSMSGVDAHAFSIFPVCVVLCVVFFMIVCAMLAGKRMVRMSKLGWFSLLIGGYFLVRCLCSYSVVDRWCETGLILGAFVYYIAGVYVAQNKTYRALYAVLVFAAVLNMVAFWAVKQPWFQLEWTGRALHTPEGDNSIPSTLFVYKNFAGVFLGLVGCVLGAGACILSQNRWLRALILSVAAAAIVVSFMCGTRAVYVSLAVSAFVLFGVRMLLRMRNERKLRLHDGLGLVLIIVCVGFVICDLFYGETMLGFVMGINTHLRYQIWEAVCEVLPGAPLWGYGANATQWEVVPFYSEFSRPNYAHNEYLQVWCDYGLIGVIGLLSILVLHFVRGSACLATDSTETARCSLTMQALVVVIAVAAYAVVDFPWHSFAFVTMCAFSCGLLSSPYPGEKDVNFLGRKYRQSSCSGNAVKVQKLPGKIVLVVLSLGLLVVNVRLARNVYPAWKAQWEYNRLSNEGEDPYCRLRFNMIAELMPSYPSSALADTYFMLPPYEVDLNERERILRLALEANPKQLFTVTMLADVLGAQQRFREADLLMRQYYIGEAMPYSGLNAWPSYYAYNLMIWGRYELSQGNHALALSLLQYAFDMHKYQRIGFEIKYRYGDKPWELYGGVKPGLSRLITMAASDLHLLRNMELQADDSWQKSAYPGGKTALYRSWVEKVR